jgi:uncharacterized membrane protein YedE/YeeE
MADSSPNQELLPSLGRLVRGLSVLFWGLPLTLMICVQTTRADLFQAFNIFPAVMATAWLLFGLRELGKFQQQERIWRHALDRAQLLGLVNVGLSPFLFWWSQAPFEPFFGKMILLFLLTAVLFLSELNQVLRRLVAMLPDETLRLETREFTTLNRGLLLTALLIAAFYLLVSTTDGLPNWVYHLLGLGERHALWLVIFFALLPLAMTMAMLWKIKAVLLDSIFGGK